MIVLPGKVNILSENDTYSMHTTDNKIDKYYSIAGIVAVIFVSSGKASIINPCILFSIDRFVAPCILLDFKPLLLFFKQCSDY